MNTYDRNLDWNICDPEPREYFGMPTQEIYFFYSEIKQKWVYELINNCDFCLKRLKRNHGKLIFINNSSCHSDEEITEFLQNKYPNAEIDMYMCEEDWVKDIGQGWR
jgi:hypothetical protein